MRFILFIFFALTINLSTLYSQKFKDSLLLKYQTTIHFNSAKSDITKNEKKKLDSVVNKAAYIRPYSIDIIAHTDKQGKENYNINLSERRAISIKNYLICNGIIKEKISFKYFGESKPLVQEVDSKNRRLNRRGVVKLFKLQKYVKINGIVTDEQGNLIPRANIEVKSIDSKNYYLGDNKGNFKAYAPLGRDITITATAKDFFYKTIKIKRKKIINSKKIRIIIPKVKKGEKFIAKNLLFYGSRCNLRPTSFDELKHIESAIKLNNTLCFEIAGHINGPFLPRSKKGSFEYELSVSRALAIYDSLKSYGISKDRLLAKGYGNWFMIYPKTREEKQMRYNRRVELMVKDCETIQADKNDILSSNFIFSVYDERFSLKNLKEVLNVLNKHQKSKILNTLKLFKAKGKNPKKFTYKELLEYSDLD